MVILCNYISCEVLQVLGRVNSFLPMVHVEEGPEIQAVPSFHWPARGVGGRRVAAGKTEALPLALPASSGMQIIGELKVCFPKYQVLR